MVRESTFSKSLPSSNDVSILTESLLPINSNNDEAITPNQIAFGVDITNTSKENNTTTGLVAVAETAVVIRSGMQHYSTCPSRFIPEVARSMSWNDPFYINDNEVIAVFDLNPNMRCGRLLSWPGLCFNLIGGIIVLPILYTFSIFDPISDPLFMYWLFSVWLWMPVGYCLLELERSRIRRGYKHVAIARRGIYIDETVGKPPNSIILMRRTVIKYEDMKECYITSFLATYSYFDVVIICKKGLFRNRHIHGNFETQKFVDIVNAMITASSSTQNFVDADAVMGTIVE